MSVSDDESFVILGTSPSPSLQQQTPNLPTTIASLSGRDDGGNSLAKDATINFLLNKSGTSPNNGHRGDDKSIESPPSLQNDSTATTGERRDGSLQRSSPNGAATTGGSGSGSSQNSIATSFILGKVTPAEMKASVFSQFPSFRSMESTTNVDDIAKLQTLLSEHTDLKETLRKTNATIMKYFTTTQEWQDDMKKKDEACSQQMKNLTELTAKLRNENIKLEEELNSKMEQIKITEELMRKENKELTSLVSEKSAQLSNMAMQIEKLEQQQLNSFEIVKQNAEDNSMHANYVPVLEHKRIVKDMERQMSVLLAENLEVKDMQKQYMDEINCLKVNLASVEELWKKAQNDISILKNEDSKKFNQFELYDKKIEELTQEMELLRAQVDIYSKDFQMERLAREALAGEKEHLLADLKLLQRKNHQLIEDAQARLEKYTSNQSTSNTPRPSFKRAPQTAEVSSQVGNTSTQSKEEQMYTPSKFICPICNISLKTLDALQIHANNCLNDC